MYTRFLFVSILGSSSLGTVFRLRTIYRGADICLTPLICRSRTYLLFPWCIRLPLPLRMSRCVRRFWNSLHWFTLLIA
jgi:hypothetical protein